MRLTLIPVSGPRSLRLFFVLVWFAVYAVGATAERGRQGASQGDETFLVSAHAALAHGDRDQARALADARASDDAAAAAIRARLAVGEGRLAEAEAILTPAAAAAPVSEAGLELGLFYARLGRHAESIRALAPIIRAARGFAQSRELVRAARASRSLGRFRQANQYFRQAAAAAPGDAGINAHWGDLFLEKYNRQDAVRSYETALRADAEWGPALVGLGRALMQENPPAAAAAVKRALTIDPASVPALLLEGEQALDEGRRDSARQSFERALEIDPSSLEARALLAAVAFLEDDVEEYEAQVAHAMDINARYGEVFRVVGAHAARNYRFDEAVRLVGQAIALSPDLVQAYADLGVHLLRTGDEPGARTALGRAFQADPYNVVTYNLLGLFDSLDKFETIEDGDLVMRLHATEVAVMREYALPLAQEALATLSARYGFEPDGPILIEIFPSHDDFAVRNVGLPGMIGALGACFGRVVTLDSPQARPPGSFSWQATLWHELAHVITLQMSKQRVPRWLTEGISVFEEKRARPEWGREMEVTFVQAWQEGDAIALRDLNAAFSSAETIALAYYEASVVVEHLVELHGEPALHRMLRAYGEGLDTDEVLRTTLDTDLDELQMSFDGALESKFGAIRQALTLPEDVHVDGAESLATFESLAAEHPGSFTIQLALGQRRRTAGDLDGAVQALERAADLIPMAVGPDSPRALLVELALEQGDRARAMSELVALLGYDHTGIETARRLAELAEEAGDHERQWLAYRRVVAIDPFDGEAHASLGRLAMGRNDHETAVLEFRVALATEPVDRAEAHCDLAEGYYVAGRLSDAKSEVLAALEMAPRYVRAQELLLKVVEGQP